ncbi:MAG: hypothetical protein QOJ64_2660 [Acidobacteriota bacterium]|jgi:uncharacterized protein (TIGR03437 family)|nr:hypothetical protein [Acidobacteriota bacterium]
MTITRSYLRTNAGLLLAGLLVVSSLARVSRAQSRVEEELKPDVQRAVAARVSESFSQTRKDGYSPIQSKVSLPLRSSHSKTSGDAVTQRPPAQLLKLKSTETQSSSYPQILAGTPLSWVLHTSQLSINSSAGTDEQYVDASGDLVADERTTFASSGGSFDAAVGRSGTRYQVFSATLNNRRVGVLSVGIDSNGDYVRNSSSTYDLERDFGLPSAVSVVSGTSKTGREFVIVSSSGYYNFNNANDPNNEPSGGVVLLVRDPVTGGFDNSRSRSIIRAGSNELNNANALALLPNNNLLIADFDSNELRIVRDTDADGIPDRLDSVPYYVYQYSNDSPLDVTANSRGVVFSHSVGNDTVMLAIYDDNSDGRADRDEVVVEGLSLDNNLVFHGLTTDREGTVYLIEDASGAADTVSSGGNLGTPQIDAFPDPALNGVLRDGALFAHADNGGTQALSGLAFGVEIVLAPVAHLSMTNSASRSGNATKGGLASIFGIGLTGGASGNSEAAASARGLGVRIEGRSLPVLSFTDSQINVYIPDLAGTGVGSVVVYLNGNAIAADDVIVSNDNPGIFTQTQNAAGEAVALLVSGLQFMRGPFSAKTNGQPTVIALFGTGWRNSLPVTVTIGGQPAIVEYAGPSGGFNGLDQLNVRIPGGVTGQGPVVVRTASGATSRTDVVVSIK